MEGWCTLQDEARCGGTGSILRRTLMITSYIVVDFKYVFSLLILFRTFSFFRIIDNNLKSMSLFRTCEITIANMQNTISNIRKKNYCEYAKYYFENTGKNYFEKTKYYFEYTKELFLQNSPYGLRNLNITNAFDRRCFF